jgi:hypothetical protein
VIVEALASTQASVVVAGHTHMQFDRRVVGQRMVNAVGPEVDLRRSVYDFQAAAEAVGRTGFPEREDLASGIVRPPSAEEAITVFERSVGQAYPA